MKELFRECIGDSAKLLCGILCLLSKLLGNIGVTLIHFDTDWSSCVRWREQEKFKNVEVQLKTHYFVQTDCSLRLHMTSI